MEKKNIKIPAGYFESNCESCKFGYKDADSLYCAMYRKTIMSGEMNNEKCPQYKMRLKDKIIAGVGIYFIVAVILELMSCGS